MVNMQSRPKCSVITNQIKLCKLFRHQFKQFYDECQLCCRTNECSKCPPAAATHDRTKSPSKWQDCLINELLWQIIPYR